MNWATNWSNCIWCGVALSPRGHHAARALPARTTREHIYPAGRGGWLVVPACGYCNSHRRDQSLYRFWASDVLRKRRAWAAVTGSWKPWAPAAELIRLYKRGAPNAFRAAPGQPISAKVQRHRAVAR